MTRLTTKDKQAINDLRRQFPAEVCVRVRRSADGGFVALFVDFPGVYTEADSFSELNDMINDAIWTYFEIPSKYRPFMPNYIPPIGMAQQLDAFPVRAGDTDVLMTQISRAETRRTR